MCLLVCTWRDGDQVVAGMVASRLGKFDASAGVLFGCRVGGVLLRVFIALFLKVDFCVYLVFSCV